MEHFDPGLIHTPVTPFTHDHRIDFDRYGKVIEFHLAHGADSLALPMHAGESVSLTDLERQELLAFAIKHINGRAPVIAHVSQSGTAIAASLARHAEETGASAVLATTPYYWTPPPRMLLEHFTQIGAAVGIPFYVHNAPEQMGGTKITSEVVLELIERLPNFSGLADASLDWQFMIEVASRAREARPQFQLLSALEYMISARAIGAKGMFSPLAGIAPKLVRQLYDLCGKEQYSTALPSQEAVSALHQVIKKAGAAGLKAAMRAMGRDCGEPRPPLEVLSSRQHDEIAEHLGAAFGLAAEPRGW